MSIASDVISENTRLASLRDSLRELLTEHGIVYYSDDDIFTLARRVWFLIHPTNSNSGCSYEDYATVGNPIDFDINQRSDDDNDLPDGSVADFFISVNGEDEIHLTGLFSNGNASCPYVPENAGDILTVKGVVNDFLGASAEMEVLPFKYRDDYEVKSDAYALVKYPSSANVSVNVVDELNGDYDYVNAVEVSKT